MIDPDIREHYELGLEKDRLQQGVSSPIEFARTKELLSRYLPPPPAGVLDVGGASGMYASWLAASGYDVHLVDPVPLHVEQAQATATTGEAPFTAELGDARSLTQPDGALDVVLLMGPLYHLTEPAERLRALGEARRVARRGGLVVATAISRFASLLDGLASAYLGDESFASRVDDAVATGVHRNPTGRPEWFTTAYFHRPDELREELGTAGMEVEAILGIEGPGWLTGIDVADPAAMEQVTRVARTVESEPCLIGASAHLLAVARVT